MAAVKEEAREVAVEAAMVVAGMEAGAKAEEAWEMVVGVAATVVAGRAAG